MSSPGQTAREVPDAEHATVYRREDEFAAWPFNVGLWQTGTGDVVAACITNTCDYSIDSNLDHRRISTYGRIQSIRSRDGGRTWEDDGVIVDCTETAEEIYFGEDPALGPFDFSDPDTMLTSWSAVDYYDPNAVPWISVSEDGGESWSDPASLPKFHFEMVNGRPSYLLRPDGTLLLTLTARAESDPEPRPVVYASFDGGQNWSFVSYIAGSTDYPMICPAPLQLESGRILAAVRINPTWDSLWTEIYASDDGGRTWEFLSRANDHGAPATLTDLGDDRVLCTYGYRYPSYGVRARISDDGGRTWGEEWIVRDGGANEDLGYPRVLRVDDGTGLAVYYYNEEEPDVPADGGVRHVASTRFTIPEP